MDRPLSREAGFQYLVFFKKQAVFKNSLSQMEWKLQMFPFALCSHQHPASPPDYRHSTPEWPITPYQSGPLSQPTHLLWHLPIPSLEFAPVLMPGGRVQSMSVRNADVTTISLVTFLKKKTYTEVFIISHSSNRHGNIYKTHSGLYGINLKQKKWKLLVVLLLRQIESTMFSTNIYI